MKPTSLATLMLLVIFLTMQACGTVVHGLHQDVEITTTPSGATAQIGDAECVTPCKLNVSRKADTVAVKKGDKVKIEKLHAGLNGWSVFLGNIFWLVPGLAVDFIAGGAYDIKPVDINLNEVEPSPEALAADGKKTTASFAVEKKLRENPIRQGDSFAVLPFVILSSDTKFSQLSQGFSENLTYYLVRSDAVKVIERTQMDKAIQEMKLGMVGIVDNSTAQAIGKVVGAKYVVIGSVEILGDHVEINCRVLRVQTSENIMVEKVSGSVDDIFSLRDQLGQRISRQIAASVGAS